MQTVISNMGNAKANFKGHYDVIEKSTYPSAEGLYLYFNAMLTSNEMYLDRFGCAADMSTYILTNNRSLSQIRIQPVYHIIKHYGAGTPIQHPIVKHLRRCQVLYVRYVTTCTVKVMLSLSSSPDDFYHHRYSSALFPSYSLCSVPC